MRRACNTEIISIIMAHLKDRRMRAKRCRDRRKIVLRRQILRIKKYIGSRRFREDLIGCALSALTGAGIVAFYILFGFM